MDKEAKQIVMDILRRVGFEESIIPSVVQHMKYRRLQVASPL